jgi:hypothetical protein
MNTNPPPGGLPPFTWATMAAGGGPQTQTAPSNLFGGDGVVYLQATRSTGPVCDSRPQISSTVPA